MVEKRKELESEISTLREQIAQKTEEVKSTTLERVEVEHMLN